MRVPAELIPTDSHVKLLCSIKKQFLSQVQKIKVRKLLGSTVNFPFFMKTVTVVRFYTALSSSSACVHFQQKVGAKKSVTFLCSFKSKLLNWTVFGAYSNNLNAII